MEENKEISRQNTEKKEEVKELSLLDKAELVAKRIEEANKRAENLLIAQETLKTKNLLGGRTTVAGEIPAVSEEDRKKERLKAYFKGSAVEKYLK